MQCTNARLRVHIQASARNMIKCLAAGEPELRKQLREKRLREMHQRMQAQLAEKQARDAAESDEKEQKVDLGNRVVKPKIDAWQQSKKVCCCCCCCCCYCHTAPTYRATLVECTTFNVNGCDEAKIDAWQQDNVGRLHHGQCHDCMEVAFKQVGSFC